MATPLAACRKMSQRKIEEHTGGEITRGALSLYENGKRIPKIETAERLAPFYGMDPDEFRDFVKMIAERRAKAGEVVTSKRRRVVKAKRKETAATAAS